jgi:hypothetical protein
MAPRVASISFSGSPSTHMPLILGTICQYKGFANPRLKGKRVVLAGVVHPPEASDDEPCIDELAGNDRVAIHAIERVGGRDELCDEFHEVWAFELQPTGDIWPSRRS